MGPMLTLKMLLTTAAADILIFYKLFFIESNAG